MDKLIVPIVFSADDNYTLFCYTAIYSLIKNASAENIYKIYVLQTNMNKENCELLESLTEPNIEVKCISILEFTQNIELKGSLHLSIETYYRLFIPLILPQYDKVLYLDSDMTIISDVAQLYKVDIGDYPVGAVLDLKTKFLKQHSLDIGNLDFEKTFNAGVLVINTKKFEELKIREKCLSLLAEDYERKERKFIFADQDVLNVVLYGNYYVLDNKWNYQPQYLWRIDDVYDFAQAEYISNQNNANIMHFAGDRKPWNYPNLPQSFVFWEYAKDSFVFKNILSKFIDDLEIQKDKLQCFDIYQFPYDKIPFESKIVIYAAGVVGQMFSKQLNLSGYAEKVLWVDYNWQQFDEKMGIKPITEITNVEYDYIVIAIDNKLTAKKIEENLIKMNIPESKIVWKNYRKN